MIEITNTKKNIIEYKCSCGVFGECMFKSPNENAVLIMDLKCPMCSYTDRIKLIKYDSEEGKNKLLENDTELHWAIVVDNMIKKEIYV